MHVTMSPVALQDQPEAEFIADFEDAAASCRDAEGFRWSMLLRSMDNASDFAYVSMWLQPEHEAAWRESYGAPAPMHAYDVTTARGAMTPAAAAAMVDWQVDAANAAGFATRWNAAYHAIEDVFGSRLLQDLDSPSNYAGFHVVTDPSKLDPRVLGAALREDGFTITPDAVQRYDVVLLTEAP